MTPWSQIPSDAIVEILFIAKSDSFQDCKEKEVIFDWSYDLEKNGNGFY